MRYCKRCVLPDTKPGIVIDEYGICNVCRHVEAKKTIDWKIEYKKKELTNYAKFHLQCWNIYKSDNGYYSKQFIDKYLEWQKQDVSNLGKQSYEFLNELLTITSYTRYSKEFTEFFTKLMGILPPKN